MHILFLTHYFPPEVNAPASRTFENCRKWVKLGHQVTVVTCAPNHPSGKVYPGHRNRWFHVEEMAGIRVVRLWTFMAANEGFLFRTLNYGSYLTSVLLNRARLPKADIVVSTSPQFFCGLAGHVAKRDKARWVLEIRDLWPESIVTVGAMNKGPVIKALEGLERWAYEKAEAIISVTDSFVPHIEARGGRGKVSVIKNGVDLALFSDSPEAGARLRAELQLEGKFIAAYVGTHGMAHGLDTVLDAAALTRDDPNLVYLLVGDGAERARLEARRASMGLGNVLMLGQRPKSDMPAVWAMTDASLILLRKSDTFTKVIPSKMFEAMAMRRPMILGVEGEARALMEAGGAGIGIEPENAEALAAAVRSLAADPALRARYGESGRAFVEREFDRDKLATRYAEILLAAAGAQRTIAPSLKKAA